MNATLAWVVWALSAAVTVLLTRNPLYLTLVALSAWLVYTAAGQASSLFQQWRGLLKIGAWVWLVTIPFNALMVHQGKIVLFRLPPSWPLIGGNITLEATIYGAVSGLVIWVLLLVFATFNVAVDASQLLRLTPSFLYQAGVVTSIALTFMPQMLASAQEIREAQQIRGHRFRGWRDLLPLFMPLLTTALEHAIELAESMESRGFGGRVTGLTPQALNRLRLRMLAALGAILAGLFVYTYWHKTPLWGALILAFGALWLLSTLRQVGRHVQRSHYRRAVWRRGDTAMVLCSLITLGVMLGVRLGNPTALIYHPYPPYPLAPEFNPWIGLALVLLAAPALVALAQETQWTVVPVERQGAP